VTEFDPIVHAYLAPISPVSSMFWKDAGTVKSAISFLPPPVRGKNQTLFFVFGKEIYENQSPHLRLALYGE
jgi:hypothetical protein